eukprot:scaffold33560_cov69-Phaeocystis_antarctica.AAC.2
MAATSCRHGMVTAPGATTHTAVRRLAAATARTNLSVLPPSANELRSSVSLDETAAKTRTALAPRAAAAAAATSLPSTCTTHASPAALHPIPKFHPSQSPPSSPPSS